jgi:methionyl-tRNA formyltransferase
MSPQTKLAFFGTDQFSATTLSALIENGYLVEIVVTKPDAPAGRKRVLTAPVVKTIAQEHNIPVFQPIKVSDIESELKKLGVEMAIVVAYGKLFPQSTLDVLPKGFINIHASLLPKYRGASPIEAALLDGDSSTGISLMKLDVGMDTGPVYAEAEYEIVPEDNQASLYDKLGRIGADLLIRELPSILDGSLQPKDQDETNASTVGLIKKSDGEIDWSKPSKEIANQIRAYSSWPGCKTTIAGEEVTILSASELDEDSLSFYLAEQEQILEEIVPKISSLKPGIPFKSPLGYLGVSCGEKTALIILQLKPAGKREMTGKEFLAGHPLP